MTEEKRKRGRPKKYESRAERQKAYHERKKERMRELEKQLKMLETRGALEFSLNSDSPNKVKQFSWKKITPSEIALMGTKELKILVDSLQDKIKENFSLGDSLENIILSVLQKQYFKNIDENYSNKILTLESEIGENVALFEECIQQQTLLYLMEAELASRNRLDDKKTKLDLFEAKVDALEQQREAKKIEIKKKAE